MCPIYCKFHFYIAELQAKCRALFSLLKVFTYIHSYSNNHLTRSHWFQGSSPTGDWLPLTAKVAHFYNTMSDRISWRRYYFLGKSYARRSNFLGNMNAAIIFPSNRISCNTGTLSAKETPAKASWTYCRRGFSFVSFCRLVLPFVLFILVLLLYREQVLQQLMLAIYKHTSTMSTTN